MIDKNQNYMKMFFAGVVFCIGLPIILIGFILNLLFFLTVAGWMVGSKFTGLFREDY